MHASFADSGFYASMHIPSPCVSQTGSRHQLATVCCDLWSADCSAALQLCADPECRMSIPIPNKSQGGRSLSIHCSLWIVSLCLVPENVVARAARACIEGRAAVRGPGCPCKRTCSHLHCTPRYLVDINYSNIKLRNGFNQGVIILFIKFSFKPSSKLSVARTFLLNSVLIINSLRSVH